ncbi:MAG: hypothetical protein JSW14_00635 [Candidatus Bathyarchaeum sp.]|nr:MAG: hypothetical protein JSW14_00635 [Candidatus Bathyarchaeum sp.]
MPGATIDHMISVTILITAMLIAMVTFNNMFASAVAYERNRQVTMKAVDLIDTACLSPGNPANWSQTNSAIIGFGLQDPESSGYSLSTYSPMRLRTSQDSQLVQYGTTFYNNISFGYGGYLLVPVGDCVNYTRTAELLGVNGTYGFGINIAPTLSVSISEVSLNPLEFKVETRGPGLPLTNASLNYYLFHLDPEGGEFPSIITHSGIIQNGSSSIKFSLDASDDAYSLLVYVHLSGLNGVGYYSRDVTSSSDALILPFVQDFENGKVIIANNSPADSVYYNATFFILNQGFQLQQVQIENSTDNLEYGTYNTTKVPASETGILLISYKQGASIGSVVMPWGIGTLGVTAVFGGDSTGYSFVATELRQVRINEVSYLVKLSAWRLRG